jgi:hypothetical protein
MGTALATSGTNYGVFGQSNSAQGFGVFASGAVGASIKSFRIDHPDDPANKYLRHYCHEGPEPQNVYNGTVILDGRGSATIELPHYFSKISRDPRYTLTAVGAPMPLLHVSVEISESALRDGGTCSFSIGGGAPGHKVSWRVDAVRNDAWVRTNGAPVEIDKDGLEKGTYQHPELFGQPPEKGLGYVRDRAAKP